MKELVEFLDSWVSLLLMEQHNNVKEACQWALYQIPAFVAGINCCLEMWLNFSVRENRMVVVLGSLHSVGMNDDRLKMES